MCYITRFLNYELKHGKFVCTYKFEIFFAYQYFSPQITYRENQYNERETVCLLSMVVHSSLILSSHSHMHINTLSLIPGTKLTVILVIWLLSMIRCVCSCIFQLHIRNLLINLFTVSSYLNFVPLRSLYHSIIITFLTSNQLECTSPCVCTYVEKASLCDFVCN